MRVSLALVIVATAVASAAPTAKKAPEPPPAPPARTPGPDDAKVRAVLDALIADPNAKDKVDELTRLAPTAVDAIGDFLHRTHAASIEDRRKLLQSIKAAVPDKNGHFPQPQRETVKEQQADDDFDWLAGLKAATGADAAVLGDVEADDLAIRALAGSKEVHAAEVIFEAAFWPETMLYRDECGRYLRKMEPYSIPALTIESQSSGDRKRYATFQIERLDRQEPGKALSAAAGNEALTIAVLDAFRATHHREAVHAVWGLVNADSPRIRKTARETWMGYVTGPPPPPAPMAKLNLPGGKKTKKPKPLWLTYRELADNELRKAANEHLGEDYPLDDPSIDDYDHVSKTVKVDLEQLTQRLFKYFDDERAKQDTAQWASAKAKADAGDLAGATAMIDQMLATSSERPERAEMAKVYFAWAKQLEQKQQWGDASAAYSKAHGLDPKSTYANEALAAHHFTLGKSLEAQGKDGGPDFRRAVAINPSYGKAKTAAAETASAASDRPVWMLYAAIASALVALGLFAAAMLKRRGAS